MKPMVTSLAGFCLAVGVGATRLQAQPARVMVHETSPANPVEFGDPLAWVQDFEAVPPGIGSLPAGWVDGGGNDAFGVVDTVACQGTGSLWLHGVLGGNWAAVVASPIVPSLAYVSDFTLELQFRNGSEPLSGAHPNRAILTMRTGPHWRDEGRLLFQVSEDRRLDGPVGRRCGRQFRLGLCLQKRREPLAPGG